MTIAGGCRCGAVRYTLAMEALPPVYACHCHECQSWSGSAFSEQAIIREQQIEVTGPIAVYERTTAAGTPDERTTYQRVCSVCHSRIYNTNTRRAGVAVVRAGTFDDSHLVDCLAHIWVKRKQPWLIIPVGVPSWPEHAPPADLVAALFGTARREA